MNNSIYPPQLPGESTIAYAAFQLFLAAGGSQAPEALASSARAKPATLRKWYQKHHWVRRLQSLTASATESALQQTRKAAEQAIEQWSARREALRATEWTLHLALVEAGQRMLERLAHTDPEHISPGDTVRLLDLASRLGRLATGMATDNTQLTADVPALKVDIEIALKRIYGDLKPAKASPAMVTDIDPAQPAAALPQ